MMPSVQNLPRWHVRQDDDDTKRSPQACAYKMPRSVPQYFARPTRRVAKTGRYTRSLCSNMMMAR